LALLSGQESTVAAYRELSLAGAALIQPQGVGDERGWFERYFCVDEFGNRFPPVQFVQFNHSYTRRSGSIRGLHLQIGAAAEDKLVKCVRGRVFDVLLDLRHGSPTLLQHTAVQLKAGQGAAAFVPRGVAHGFQTLADDTELIYHHSNAYDPSLERGVRFDDPRAAIEWPLAVADVSAKDGRWPLLSRAFTGFEITPRKGEADG
jgi:dTDP-4-dehydrorhamnose 3,5-epimerase